MHPVQLQSGVAHWCQQIEELNTGSEHTVVHALGTNKHVKRLPITYHMSHASRMVTGPGGELATAEEADRLEAILKAFPTTEDEDAALLKGEKH